MRCIGRGAVGLLLLVAAAAAAEPCLAQAPGETTAFESKQYRFAVAVPAGCRREEGPGTLDAVCAVDFDAAKSAAISSAKALVLGVAVEPLAGDADATATVIQERYSLAGFREELPETVCGESDRARVKLDNVKQSVEDARVVYSADVVCAEIRFLQIGERRAAVRTVVGPDIVYRLVGRAPSEDFEKQRAAIDAFFASFRALPADK